MTRSLHVLSIPISFDECLLAPHVFYAFFSLLRRNVFVLFSEEQSEKATHPGSSLPYTYFQ